MSDTRPTTLSLKAENFVSGIVRFIKRYARTTFITIIRPRSFSINLPRSRRLRKIVPPLTFLIVGCFLYSVIIDTYAEGWIVYFNWIWLDQEISQKLNERGPDLFSLTAIARSGLPTFLTFLVLAQSITIILTRSRWLRPRVFSTVTYAFGLHAMAFAIACFLPIIGVNALNPNTSDSVVSSLSHYGLEYLVMAATAAFALIAFISPILLLAWSAQRREARFIFKPFATRLVASVPIFFISIFLATEFGSLPARFTDALVPTPKVKFQAMDTPELIGHGPGDLSGANFAVLLHNETEDLTYVDASSHLVSVTIIHPNGTELDIRNDPITEVFDEHRAQRTLLPILPGEAQLVFLETRWQIDGTLGTPSYTSSFDGAHSYDGLRVVLDYSPVQGGSLVSDLTYDLGNPSVLLSP